MVAALTLELDAWDAPLTCALCNGDEGDSWGRLVPDYDTSRQMPVCEECQEGLERLHRALGGRPGRAVEVVVENGAVGEPVTWHLRREFGAFDAPVYLTVIRRGWVG